MSNLRQCHSVTQEIVCGRAKHDRPLTCHNWEIPPIRDLVLLYLARWFKRCGHYVKDQWRTRRLEDRLTGYFNKPNCRIWSEANPQVYVQTLLHPEKLTVWFALWAGGIIGPYFFKNDEGHNVTVNGDRYRAVITNFFIPELNNHDVQDLWFQQDGATCHTARATIDLLKDTFGDRLISRFGPVNWPPRSCDLTPLDYLLWGYVKSLVYVDKPQTLDHLEDNIRRVIADIRSQMLEKSSKIGRPDLTTSELAVAVLCQKLYLKCNATRLAFE
ncbi:transposable element Tc3 transposase [Trichonephila clavipes]|nr:transposable element Tc3 transposase [Trichonephila clavipes]